MAAEFKFRASDAFVYVDTYRREILHPAGRVQADLARVRDQAGSTNANLSPTRYYAELRALEHALNFVLKREEPDMVVLGEAEEGATVEGPGGTKVVKSAKQLATELSRCEEHGSTLEITLKQAKSREHELQGEIVSREQQIARMQHRLANAQQTTTVLTVTVVVTIIVLLLVIFG